MSVTLWLCATYIWMWPLSAFVCVCVCVCVRACVCACVHACQVELVTEEGFVVMATVKVHTHCHI